MKYEVIRTDTADAGIRKKYYMLRRISGVQLHLRNLMRLRNVFLDWERIHI